MRQVLGVTFIGSYMILTIFCVEPLRQSGSYENLDLRNKLIPGTSISQIGAESKMDCAKHCRDVDVCLSFSYNSFDKLCRIFDEDFFDATNSTDNEDGNRYYYMIKDCQHTESTCPQSMGYAFNLQICFCFKIHTTRQNYSQSVKLCNNEDAEVANINRGLRQMEIQRILEETNTDVFIQGTRSGNTTTWHYDDGTTLTYFNWNRADGQPQNRDSEIHLLVRKYQGYRWHDVFEVEHHSVICEA